MELQFVEDDFLSFSLTRRKKCVSVIALTTDFGQQDGYVGAMKGVILRIAPSVTLVDVSHDIAPQNIAEAAFILYSSYHYFPTGTVHLTVVDPGVGTTRRPIAIRTTQGIFVAPDNGVLSYILAHEESWSAVHLTESRYWLPHVSHTFHGRDIFAPVAAHLAAGTAMDQLGPEIRDLVQLPLYDVVETGSSRLSATVLYVDRFGNIVTNLAAGSSIAGEPIARAGNTLRALIGGQTIQGLLSTYGNANAGDLLLLVGSSGFVEIACCGGNAAVELDIHVGDTVIFEIC